MKKEIDVVVTGGGPAGKAVGTVRTRLQGNGPMVDPATFQAIRGGRGR